MSSTSHGTLRARIERRACGTTSDVADVHAAAPLKLAPLRHLPDGTVDAIVMECSPGLLPGDSSRHEWHVGTGASLRIGTQGHQRVHGAASGPPRPASQLTHSIVAEPGARVALLPEPIVLHRGAGLDATTRVELHGDAVAIVTEIVAGGRIAHGEHLAFRSWRASFDLCVDGALVAASRQLLEPTGSTDGRLDALLDGATHWGSLHVACGAWDADRCDLLRIALEAELARHGDVVGAVDTLERAGVVVLARARGAWPLVQALRALAAVADGAGLQSIEDATVELQ